jgi:phage protein D
LHEYTVLADLAHQRTAISVTGWDVAGKAALRYEATDSALGGELDGGVSGAAILGSGFGPRKDEMVQTVPLTAQEAQSAAEAAYRLVARRFVTGRGVAEVEAGLRVGRTVDLQGLGPLFGGKYYVAEVRHRFDIGHGIRTEFTAERPGLGRPS